MATDYGTASGRPASVLEAQCRYCAAADATHPTFTGGAICDRCVELRQRIAALLSLVVRGATPETVQPFAALTALANASDPDETQEMEDLVDLLLDVQG